MLKKIFIKDLEWEINLVDTTNANLMADGSLCYGSCRFFEQKIYLDNRLIKEQMFRTLKHELTHAFIYSYLIEKKQSYTEEDLCDFIAIYGEEICNMAKIILEKIEVNK